VFEILDESRQPSGFNPLSCFNLISIERLSAELPRENHRPVAQRTRRALPRTTKSVASTVFAPVKHALRTSCGTCS
jgi:hypothetical protein